NKNFRKSDVVAIEDHINFMGVNPVVGPHEDKLGPRFVDMCEPYSKRLLKAAKEVAKEKVIDLKEGVYIAFTGPSLETRAEYRMIQRLGADMVGMSTVPEVIVGVQSGFEILGLSVITDLCFPESLEPAKIEEIIKAAKAAGPKLDTIIEGVVAKV
ncbi:MAG: purine-nucleoside phosphorylase, partial [Candidatus Omnitrophica bacterium]|nr:purine-nucleoside phosphorylase [Candidatus Omnitrophota bacterium]